MHTRAGVTGGGGGVKVRTGVTGGWAVSQEVPVSREVGGGEAVSHPCNVLTLWYYDEER